MARIAVGRDRELAAAAAFVGDGRGALVFAGEPGIGKTTVLAAALEAAAARGFRVLSCRPAESEVSLPFVSLGDLLVPALPGALDALPGAQRAALEAALARVEPDETFGRLAVSRATLAVLRALAPAVIAIDDAQWLDPASADVLGFALRRLPDAAIRVLLTRRGGESFAPDVPTTTIGLRPLSVDELGRVVADELDRPLSRPRLVELHATCGGNPYYAREIVRALRERAEPIRAGDALPVPDGIAGLLRARIDGLSPAAVDALLLTAASPHATAESIASPDGVAEALAAGILEPDAGRLRFTHPLLASVVYHGAGAPARQAAHARLAAAAADPDERAHHLARARTEPDAAVAAELDAAATRAYRRGAPAAAAELAAQACRLTPAEHDAQHFARTLRSAELHLAAGDTAQGRALLEPLLERRASGPDRARVALRLGSVRYTSDDVDAAHALFRAALTDAQGDAALTAEAEQALAFTAVLGGDVASALRHASAALELAEAVGEPRILALACARAALTRFIAGQGLDPLLLGRAVALEPGHLDDAPIEWLPSYAAAWCRLMSDDLGAARALYERLALAADERTDERFTATVLFARSELETRAGHWPLATRLAEEAVERSRQAGLGTVLAWALHARVLVAAHAGHTDAAREAAAEGLQVAQDLHAVAPLTQITATLGFLELARGDPAAAHRHLGPFAQLIASVGVAEPGVARFIPDAVEALIGTGALAQAAALLEPLEERSRSLDRISMRAAAARCRAMLAAAGGELDRARAALDDAFAQHARLHEPFERARTLLAQGTIERRARRRGQARAALTSALALFDDLGAALWAERTAAELARIPGRAPASDALSESERRVVELAVQGLANKEIAARLYVTVRTVETHLSKIYAKLGVRSRVELMARTKD